MTQSDVREHSEFIRSNLRLKTSPVAISYRVEEKAFPDKTRRPLSKMGRRFVICQAITTARYYGWTVGLTREDILCVPAAILFGFSDSQDPSTDLTDLFTEIGFSKDVPCGAREIDSLARFEKGEIESILVAPAEKALFDPDLIVIYGNPVQVMRLSQAWSYMTGNRIPGFFGGKLECEQYLIVPFKTGTPQISIPGNGERIFAMAQDDEMVFALPARSLPELVQGLSEAGRAIGARYPVPPFQFFEPDLPRAHKTLGKKIGVL
ncbi:MAG: DUF169 domain-containing protein [Syntrophales bacterium]|nr:DUF169 domain-containing protein [Syntrophales bacterium]MDX9921999.1 DUF169 domain-containing protein [Syntrophales bacterium]